MSMKRFGLQLLLVFVGSLASAQSIHRAKLDIIIGPTVQVSEAFPRLTHGETLAAGDPRHPGRLMSCSIVYPNDGYKSFLFNQYCYASFDSGKSWHPSLKITEGRADGDPAVIYGQGEDVYVTSLTVRDPDKPENSDPNSPLERTSNTIVFRSSDGGRTWGESSRFEFTDREFINVDTTGSKYAGRIYIVGQGSVRGISGEAGSPGIKMWRSIDNGKTFLGPVTAAYPLGSDFSGVGTVGILSDGTLVAMFGLVKPGRKRSLDQSSIVDPNAEIHVITSRDGGETFAKSIKLADFRTDRLRSEGGLLGQLAVDSSSTPFKDRIYVVYPDVVSGRIQIQLSYSSDKGKTWSKPTIINDDRSPEKEGDGPDHLLPSVAVNKDGVVVVAWYDRREAGDNLGWRIRAAASLDGGETFSASVPVSDGANAYGPGTPWDIMAFVPDDSRQTGQVSASIRFKPFFTSAGHTSGMAVDADGSFHPTWIDNHTGVPQLWSASLKVVGKPVNHGTPELSDLDDISRSVALELSNLAFDRKTGNLGMTARIRNVSNNAVLGPIKVRVVTLESGLGIAEVTNADNREKGTGAIWDFSGLVPGGSLQPMKLTNVKALTFRLTDLRPIGQGKDFMPQLFRIETHIYGRLH